jgi:hypothetical protein
MTSYYDMYSDEGQVAGSEITYPPDALPVGYIHLTHVDHKARAMLRTIGIANHRTTSLTE